MRFQVQSFGLSVVSTKFTRMARSAMNARPALNNVADYLMQITEAQFESQGRRAGGSWRRLTPEWLARKIKEGHDPRILHMRGALRRSMTRRRARGQVLEITPYTLRFGSNLPHAATHQYGRKGIPARPFFKTTTKDREKMRDEIRDHLMQAWRVGGGGSAR